MSWSVSITVIHWQMKFSFIGYTGLTLKREVFLMYTWVLEKDEYWLLLSIQPNSTE